MVSGSLNDSFPGVTPNTLVNDDTYRSRASASYITGSHNAKIGFEGAYFSEKIRNEANDIRLNYHYITPATTGHLEHDDPDRELSAGSGNGYLRLRQHDPLQPGGSDQSDYFRPKPVDSG